MNEVLDQLLDFQKQFTIINGNKKSSPFVKMLCNFCLFVISELRKNYEN